MLKHGWLVKPDLLSESLVISEIHLSGLSGLYDCFPNLLQLFVELVLYTVRNVSSGTVSSENQAFVLLPEI